MNLILKPFQIDAVDQLAGYLRLSSAEAERGGSQAVILSAPTGSGKTVIATRLIEILFTGDDDSGPDEQATVLWLTDQPELNEQTRQKMLDTSDLLGWSSVEVIESHFDQKAFLPHRVYFLNTQKLAKDARLVTHGDRRSFTIWETIRNTIDAVGGHLIVFIDEAHRGMTEDRADQEAAASIVQKFIKGSPGEIPSVPVIFGISATPERFTSLLAGTSRTQRPVHVDPEDVRNSGLLKEVITLYNPTEDQPSDLTMLRAAARRLRAFEDRWKTYTSRDSEEDVDPIMVVQVQDATKTRKSATNIGSVIDAIDDEIGPLQSDAYAHAFQEGTAITESGHDFRYLAPSKISSDPAIKVVFFKSSLNTGWDCPRAEVMMSFRRAKDATMIAQLIGRMVRTPLARRIDEDEYLNTVALYLPHYDEAGLHKVIDRLTKPDYTILPPADVIDAKELEILHPTAGSREAIKILESIPSFVIPKKRKTPQVRRLMGLARLLANDHLDDDAYDEAQDIVMGVLDEALARKLRQSAFTEFLKEKEYISLKATDASLAGHIGNGEIVEIEASDENINDLFHAAGRRIGEGLHKEFWRRRVGEDGDRASMRRAKLEAFGLAQDPGVLAEIDSLAQSTVQAWLDEHWALIKVLPESRRQRYADIRGQAASPERTGLEFPEFVESRKSGKPLEGHLYVNEEGSYQTTLNTWETQLLEEELEIEDLEVWFRNIPRKPWSFTVPYEMDGAVHPLYPDFLFLRRTGNGLIVDVVDPHDPGQPDAPYKAVGLAQFARDHGQDFGRIELVALDRKVLKRLDLQDEKIRDRVLKVRDRSHLDDLYRTA